MTRAGTELQVSVHIFAEFLEIVSEQWLSRVAQHAFALESERAADANRPSSVEVVVADDDTVRDLNRRHRGLDEATDVLSFSYTHQGEFYGEDNLRPEGAEQDCFVLPPGEAAGIGEVVISYPQVLRQAEESKHTPQRELALLVTHGMLHLLGYDHREPAEEAAMEARVAGVLARVLDT